MPYSCQCVQVYIWSWFNTSCNFLLFNRFHDLKPFRIWKFLRSQRWPILVIIYLLSKTYLIWSLHTTIETWTRSPQNQWQKTTVVHQYTWILLDCMRYFMFAIWCLFLYHGMGIIIDKQICLSSLVCNIVHSNLAENMAISANTLQDVSILLLSFWFEFQYIPPWKQRISCAHS